MNDRSPAATLISGSSRGNEAAILNAALAAFGEKGFNGASMRDIARGAETSLSNLYNYFPSKSHLLAELLQRANAELLNRTSAAVRDADSSAAARLREAVKAYVGFVVDHQTAALVAISEIRYLHGEDRNQVVRARDKTQAIFGAIVADGVAAGEFATPYPDGAARNIVSMCSAISTWYSKQGRLSKEHLAEQHARYALALLEARPDRDPTG
ncbi:TetR/AcrR family transcriptional regulator [Saccharopolyspora rhizosphaerae]|uniref:TetR/AcrR family transcriptional regulator n=1 Tax=Saccharopolyspora rhizosphaerae TaxID=2492662 RepID=A0A426JV51_9PSEU|nr:TetR/AcrR family transcriptional regulator [Saccharopolyspora rhizosphaerae]RRO16971.1 TetR/AcrR family transcriptional regulator [Saccharopolyspora rhizosphaerae]